MEVQFWKRSKKSWTVWTWKVSKTFLRLISKISMILSTFKRCRQKEVQVLSALDLARLLAPNLAQLLLHLPCLVVKVQRVLVRVPKVLDLTGAVVEVRERVEDQEVKEVPVRMESGMAKEDLQVRKRMDQIRKVLPPLTLKVATKRQLSKLHLPFSTQANT